MPAENKTNGTFWGILPNLLWFLLASVALFMFYQPLSDLITRSTKLKVGAIEVEAKVVLERSAQRLPEEFRRRTSTAQVLRLKTQWASLPERHRPYRILVAHDVFIEARPIQIALADLGFDADIALCPDEIKKALKQHLYDGVISDIAWDKCKSSPSIPTNGIEFLNYATQQGFSQPTVFFIANYDPKLGVPKHSYGISNNWYDVLESLFAAIKYHAPDKIHEP